MVSILAKPSEREIKFLLTAAIILITPNPVPPVVTISPEVFLSRAIPETGWPKSQKYLKVCF